MIKQISALALVAALGGCFQPTSRSNAQGAESKARSSVEVAPPNLVGKWVGTGESAVRGKALHHESAPADKPLLDNVEFTMLIEGQDAHRFWGTVSSSKGSEPLTGVVAWDGATLHARSSDGIINGTLVDPDTIELIYSQSGPATVVAINRYKRQK